MTFKDGKIIKGIGGFYYVETADGLFECKARGSFRRERISPLVGDNVSISLNESSENRIEKIYERKNFLVRPPIANIDQLFIISSIIDPVINCLVLDKLIVMAEFKKIEPIIVITKADLDNSYSKFLDIYSKAGFKTILSSKDDKSAALEIKSLFSGKISAFTGNSGVGKSTILNLIDENLNIETGVTSKKLGRGKHTTRHSQLYKINNGYVADTPGFSSLDFERCETILKDDLPYCFREFLNYLGECKFSSCSHVNDKGCKIVEAVQKGEISNSRHNSYVQMYNEVKDIKEWDNK